MNLNKFDCGRNGVSVNRNKEYVDVDNDTPPMVPTRPDIKITCVRISQMSKIGKDTKMLMW